MDREWNDLKKKPKRIGRIETLYYVDIPHASAYLKTQKDIDIETQFAHGTDD